MSNRKFILPAIILATALGGAAPVALMAQDALAQAATSAPHPAAKQHHQRPNYIEGRIAFLKAELKITPAQEAQFDKVAQIMRENAQERRATFEKMRADHSREQTALQRLETGAHLASMHAQASDRFLAAFRPLYDSLSPAQKKTADALFNRFGHHFHRGRI